jgi:hypothetical protein
MDAFNTICMGIYIVQILSETRARILITPPKQELINVYCPFSSTFLYDCLTSNGFAHILNFETDGGRFTIRFSKLHQAESKQRNLFEFDSKLISRIKDDWVELGTRRCKRNQLIGSIDTTQIDTITIDLMGQHKIIGKSQAQEKKEHESLLLWKGSQPYISLRKKDIATYIPSLSPIDESCVGLADSVNSIELADSTE